MNWKIGIAILAVGSTVALVGGCFSPDPKSLTSDSPPSAIPAIKDAADQNDRKAIPRLVQDLSDQDSAIRFAAITALRRMTGEDFGYRYYESESERGPAITRWNEWLKAHPSP